MSLLRWAAAGSTTDGSCCRSQGSAACVIHKFGLLRCGKQRFDLLEIGRRVIIERNSDDFRGLKLNKKNLEVWRVAADES